MSREEWTASKYWRVLWPGGGMYEGSEKQVRAEAKKHKGAEIQRLYHTDQQARVRWVRQ
jgi:hypothetical protein